VAPDKQLGLNAQLALAHNHGISEEQKQRRCILEGANTQQKLIIPYKFIKAAKGF